MAFDAIAYKVLIASPSDVPDERSVVSNVIQEWNIENASEYKTVFIPIKWETNAYPTIKVEGRPQEFINEQLVRNCDVLIGIFWTKLGTPTGKADSGTAEEINEFLEAGKHVMLYFSTVPVALDAADSNQYRKLKKFKETCKPKGIVESYDSVDELARKVKLHLTYWLREQKPPMQNIGTTANSDTNSSSALQSADAKTALNRLRLFAVRMRADWITERDSGTQSVDGAKRMLAQISSALSDFYGVLSEFLTEEDLAELMYGMKIVKQQKEAVKLRTMGFDRNAMWNSGEEVCKGLESYATRMEEKFE
jgi:hypothetical protein